MSEFLNERDGSLDPQYNTNSIPSMISDYDLYLFSEGTHDKVWHFLGAHERITNGIFGINVAVWAPNAKSVRLIGDFNAWDEESHFMNHRGGGIWEIFTHDLSIGMLYKFAIESSDGNIKHKTDPYAFYNEHRPNTASVVYVSHHEWEDKEWMDKRHQHRDKALSIYECHLGSWIKSEDEEPINYRELAESLSEYLLEHGFTHLELMPISEYPYDGSWGYQVTGYFAPTSRYGSPDDFRYFVDYLHQRGLGIILDWVPAHFPADSHGLERFDGTALYEHEDARMGWHNDWKTHIFNYGRREVSQFLIGSALMWLEEFHIDGIRVDAVASMLYLDYSREQGQWIPNRFGGRENLEAIEFIKNLNHKITKYHPEVMTIAEESTSFIGVTKPVQEGGLGFTYKWNMGWMHDTLKYFSIDPIFRKYHHQQITFSLMYSFSENYILPLSHDEVVHGKGTLLSRMPGSEWEKFANLRLMFVYMWAHVGKKMIFHGQEWGSWREWSENKSIDWHLNEFALHSGLRALVKDLNFTYRHHPALFERDQDSTAFQWIDCDNSESGLLIWGRWDKQGNGVLTVLNLNPIAKNSCRIGVPRAGTYEEILNSDKAIYGGAEILNTQKIPSESIPYQAQDQSILLNIGPLSGLMFSINH
ncbi:MAG: 1,4-alpha-glucan branching protein GlgB [Brevinema sp.]